MSTATPSGRASAPALTEGDCLDQPEFHRRYEAMPPGIKAELVDGIVHMPSPVSEDHGDYLSDMVFWLASYAAGTPGVKASGELTTILGRRSEPQPDATLRIRPEFGGQTSRDRSYVRGAPELVVEIARTSLPFDLGPKRDDYERAGVREYLVRALDPD
jgi:Uma2 family endonuclease